MGTIRVTMVLALCGSVVAAAPVPKDRVEPPYYPTKVGTKLVYDYLDGNDELVFVVTEVKDIKGGKRVTIERRDLRKPVPEVVDVTGAGVFVVAGPSGELDPPAAILRIPFRVGDKWKFNYDETPGIRAGSVGTDTVIGVEKVKVPAGTFEAVRVDTEVTNTVGEKVWHFKFSRWYGPHVGLVQEKDEKGELIRALKTVTLPKE